jgi:hypothetical protein
MKPFLILLIIEINYFIIYFNELSLNLNITVKYNKNY